MATPIRVRGPTQDDNDDGASDMTQIYELRTYTAEPGRLDALLARFRDHTAELFTRHGMTNIGYWVTADQPDTLVYLLAHADPESAAASWEAFKADPEWQAVRAASEEDGPIVQSITSVFLEPTDFSALR
ncbi:NIPSNAP family protein [Cellulomonas sp. P24]|uniref:NIPSNAP family protein n=1 Tax=Cellulomonas sp. P24 TaxID=2885206 RepID=UPI00216B47C2|nr:NIPSNAP family protein [Cellulomonas sp. P24]MCR6493911.1 NIPSNAP family protein [Cellulomonas sp. P24]